MDVKCVYKGWLPKESETIYRIMITLINSDEPIPLSQISKESGIDRQLVHHHLPSMIGKGLVIRYKDKKYWCQEALRNTNDILENMRSIIMFMSMNVDSTQSDDHDRAVFENLMCILAIISRQR